MKKQTTKRLKEKLEQYIIENKGKYDFHYVFGNYGISYNIGLDYFTIYNIVEGDDGEIIVEDSYFDGKEQYFEIFGKNFLDNCESTQIRKIRNYFKEYSY